MIVSKNKPFSGLDKRYRGNIASTNYSLCVGAGISFGLVPTWQELTRLILNEVFSTSYDPKGFQSLVDSTRWSLDALLQGAANQLILDGQPIEKFEELLEKHLYSTILNHAKKYGVEKELIEALNNPRNLKKDQVIELCDYLQKYYKKTTLVKLAEVFSVANGAGKLPKAVINFNADTLLHAVLDTFLIREHARKLSKWEHPKKLYAKSFQGIDSIRANVTPIYHCHGAVSPLTLKLKKKKLKDSRSNLVFREQEYLEIAGSMSTWAQTVFLFYAQSSRLLIIGHSMSDPNIRKWLAWSHENSLKEISSRTDSKEITPRHIWIARNPKDKTQKKIQEVSLLHIGVRVCWIDNWHQVDEVFKNLLAI